MKIYIDDPIEKAIKIITKFKEIYQKEIEKMEKEKKLHGFSLNGNTDFFKTSSKKMLELCEYALANIEENRFNVACYVLKRILNRHPLTRSEQDKIDKILQRLKLF
jgi:hypothetical protein